jgi:hypothetical protein
MVYQRAADVPFERVAELFERLLFTKKAKKFDVLKKWRKSYLPQNTEDIYRLYRMLIPQARCDRLPSSARGPSPGAPAARCPSPVPSFSSDHDRHTLPRRP